MDWFRSLLGTRCGFCGASASHLSAPCFSCRKEWHALAETAKPELVELDGFTAVACLRYEGWAKNLILSQKESPQNRCVDLLARLLVDSLPNAWREKPLCWIPGSAFGQIHFVEKLSLSLAKRGAPLAPQTLLTRNISLGSKAQKNLDLESRTELARSVKRFRVSAAEDENGEVVLLDDVLTTGTTLKACKLLLERHRGVKVLGALTLAYAPLTGEPAGRRASRGK